MLRDTSTVMNLLMYFDWTSCECAGGSSVAGQAPPEGGKRSTQWSSPAVDAAAVGILLAGRLPAVPGFHSASCTCRNTRVTAGWLFARRCSNLTLLA